MLISFMVDSFGKEIERKADMLLILTSRMYSRSLNNISLVLDSKKVRLLVTLVMPDIIRVPLYIAPIRKFSTRLVQSLNKILACSWLVRYVAIWPSSLFCARKLQTWAEVALIMLDR